MDQDISSKQQQIISLMRAQQRAFSRWNRNDPEAPMIVGTTSVMSFGPIDYAANTNLQIKGTLQETAALLSTAIQIMVRNFPEEEAEFLTAQWFAMIMGTLATNLPDYVLAQIAVQATENLELLLRDTKKDLENAKAVSKAMWKQADRQREQEWEDD